MAEAAQQGHGGAAQHSDDALRRNVAEHGAVAAQHGAERRIAVQHGRELWHGGTGAARRRRQQRRKR